MSDDKVRNLWREVLRLAMDDAEDRPGKGRNEAVKYLTTDSINLRRVCALADLPADRVLASFKNRYGDVVPMVGRRGRS